jgi:hypothetical protein
MAYDQHPIQQAKGLGRNDKQVHRGGAIRMIVQEGLPALRRRSSSSRHILGNAGLAKVDAELDHFAVDARCAPQWIGNAHLPDQLPDLGRYLGAARPRPRLPVPVTPETFAMPPNHGLGPNDGKRLAGFWKELADPAQNHPVDG